MNQVQYQSVSHLQHQANVFANENAERIARITDVLLGASSSFMDKVGQKNLPDDVCHALLAYLGEKDLLRFQRLMRQHQAAESGSIARAAYWHLNDAISFLEDALGTHWRYLSMEGRDRSLVFVEQTIQDFDFLMSNLDADPKSVMHFQA